MNKRFLIGIGLMLASCGEKVELERNSSAIVIPESHSNNESVCDKDFYVTWQHLDASVTAYKVAYGPTKEEIKTPVAYWNEGGSVGQTFSSCFSSKAIPDSGTACFAVYARNTFGVSPASTPVCIDYGP